MTEHNETDEIPALRLLDAADLAYHFKVDVKTIRRWGRTGILPPAVTIGPRVSRWRAVDIAEWVRNHMQPYAPQANSRFQPVDIYDRLGHFPAAYVPRAPDADDKGDKGDEDLLDKFGIKQ